MNISIRGNNVALTNELEQYVQKRLHSIEKFLDDAAKITVELGKTTNHHKTGDIFRAEINVNNRGTYSRAVSEQDNLHAAVDVMQGEISSILSANKDKKHTIWKRGSQKVKNILRGIGGFGRQNN